ncbi:ribonuclease R [Mycoplasmopsis cynos]|uniref:ribonuclease R n=1 Tax=Mycoplasmopsis cynos TaxID=171284 RepID=UPI0024CC35B2|nr:ribonuclease R [Mycoplasmopsis cynos]WAM03445.1 ribonuclease R [Mycoplasmopsis cynos]
MILTKSIIQKSVFIKSFNFNGAIHNDTVQVNIYINPRDNESNNSEGVITNVIQRNNTEVQGFIKHKNNTIYFSPVDSRYQNLTWVIVSKQVQTKLNDLVVAEIQKYDQKIVFINIVKVITNESDPMVFVKYYLESIKVPNDFPSLLEREIHNIPLSIKNENQNDRINLTSKMIVTIDGDDTKDFDDAIYVKKLANGNFILGVYIADVSYYVKEDTLIDQEALKRGTSIYLVDRVIPMSPIELSNGICSLNPNEERFVIACEMEIDKNGKNLNVNVFPGIIESKFRLTYKQVDNYFKTNDLGFNNEPNNLLELKSMLNDARDLSLILHKYKINEGYVDFEISEPKIKLDEFGSVKEIIINQRGFSEVLIEDFMVRRNETIAKYLTMQKLPVLYRINETPDELKISNLKNTLFAMNIKDIKLDSKTINPKNFAELVGQINKIRNDDFIKMMFLRTMQNTVYSENNIGHFGLASKFYCHFTSPIRRYPDLVIHRIIREFIFNKNLNELESFTNNKMSLYSDLNTKAEQKAVQIERNVNDLKFAEFLKNRIGSVFKAQILSITNFGFFVEFDFKASGMIHKSTLVDGVYEANETLTKFSNGTKTFILGDFVNVVVVGVDLVEGKIDCVLEDLYLAYLNAKKASFEHKKKTPKHTLKSKGKG